MTSPLATLKEHKEFHQVNMSEGWHPPPGYPAGIEQKILAGWLDEENGRGNRTRLLRFLPKARTDKPFVHAYWEEVYILEGDLIVGDPSTGMLSHPAHTYACRPPGVFHGPFRSEAGCLLLEIHYYEAASIGKRQD